MNNENTLSLITVSSLICHRDVPMALKCLGSLLRHCQNPIQFVLHDDGSLQEEDIELLSNTLHSPRIIGISDSNERMERVLQSYPHALEFRRTNLFAKKIFDCISYNTSDIFAYCDTDVFFFKPFFDLFVLPDNGTHALFLRDIVHPYSIKLRDYVTAPDIRLVQHVNAGMVCFRRTHYDLDFLEWLLSKKMMHSKPYLTEQTLWAMLGDKVSCRLWDSSQIVHMTSSTKITTSVVAGHFVSPVRHLLKQYIETDEATSRDNLVTDDPVQVRTVLSKLCHPVDIAWMLAKSEIGRRLSKRYKPSGNL